MCDYRTPNSDNWCFVVDAQTITNWDSIPGDSSARCRNVDESFFNAGYAAIRLHYHPMNADGGGAWVCVPAGDYVSNLSGYTFNNGAGDDGYGAPVENDVGGDTYGGTCSNPI